MGALDSDLIWTVPWPKFRTDSSSATIVYEGADSQRFTEERKNSCCAKRHQLCVFLPQYDDTFKCFFDLQDENLKYIASKVTFPAAGQIFYCGPFGQPILQ